MGKSKRHFIDPKRDVLHTFKLVRKKPVETEAVLQEKKSCLFQLKDGEGNNEAAAIDFELAAEDNRVDLRNYGVYFKDDYDYLQHLKDPEDTSGMDDDMELFTISKDHAQKGKKNRRSKLVEIKDPDKIIYVPPVVTYSTDLPDVPEDVDDMFADADSDSELPDDLFTILDAEEPVTELPRHHPGASEGQSYDEQRGAGFYAEMPPLEEVNTDDDDEDVSSYRTAQMKFGELDVEDDGDDCNSHISNDSLYLSDGGESDDDLTDNKDKKPKVKGSLWLTQDAFPTMAEATVLKEEEKKKKKLAAAMESLPVVHNNVDDFFDSVGKVHEEEDEEKPGTDMKWVPVRSMKSSKNAKNLTSEAVAFNDQFAVMLRREYGSECGDLEDVQMEYIDDNVKGSAGPVGPVGPVGDASTHPQFTAAMNDLRRHYHSNRDTVALVGDKVVADTEDEARTRQAAIDFTKNWRNTKAELVDVSFPDPKAMKYNASNCPSVRTRNTQSIIDRDLTRYLPGYKRKARKGLSTRDMRRHDQEMNTPKREEDDDQQTFKTMMSELSIRPIDETPEERRERKLAFKELRKGRREEKKVNNLVHRDMLILTCKVKMNARHCKTISMI